MFKPFVIISFCCFALIYGGGYDEPQASQPAAASQSAAPEEEKHRGEGWVRGGQEESHNPAPAAAAPEQEESHNPGSVAAPEQEINHEWSFSGAAPKVPEAPPPPRVRGDGPAPASYPALIPHATNAGSFSGKGGYQEGPSAPGPAAAPAPQTASAPAPQQGYKQGYKQ